MNTSKAAVGVSSLLGKIASLVGYVLGVFSLIIIIVGLTDLGSSGAFTAMMFLVGVLVGCVALIIKGKKIKRRIMRFRRYVSMISRDGVTSIAILAEATSQSVDFVKNDIQRMIDKKFFVNAVIDWHSGEIIIGGRVPGAEPQQVTAAEYVPVKCTGCGATNLKQKGLSGACEYCGSLI